MARVLLLAAGLLALGAGTSAAATKTCFGAAARDSVRPCTNATRSVVPAPDDESGGRSARCRPVDEEPASICTFGAPARKSKGHVALVGDSHALHWRTALDVVARALRWRGHSITAPGCLFSEANDVLHEGIRGACEDWHRQVLRWFRAHPEVSTVFISQNVDTPLAPQAGRTSSAVKIAGYRTAWRRLPKTVKRVVVIRDTPLTAATTLDCLRRVVAAGVDPPGLACGLPRSAALRWDTAFTAARSLRSKRYRAIDLSESFCDRRTCFAAVGGVRVYSDTVGHITATYSRSLGPYLLRKVRRLLRSR